MSIAFDPASVLPALAGGALIGAGSALLVLRAGRIAGISGIVGDVADAATGGPRGDLGWRLAFLLGLIGLPLLVVLLGFVPKIEMQAGPLGIIAAGLLVGIGARLGSGCTSGHAVCGISRLSPRSLVATGVFMFTAGLTVWVVRHGVPA